jgi:hypothetical protein
MATYIVITAVEVEAGSINDAAERAMEHVAKNGAEHFVQPANSVTRAAVEAALDGAEMAVDR